MIHKAPYWPLAVSAHSWLPSASSGIPETSSFTLYGLSEAEIIEKTKGNQPFWTSFHIVLSSFQAHFASLCSSALLFGLPHQLQLRISQVALGRGATLLRSAASQLRGTQTLLEVVPLL